MKSNFMDEYQHLCRRMLGAPVIHTGSWQSTDTSASPTHATHEMEDVLFTMTIPQTITELQRTMPAINLPWAELHFQERVGGQPLNPPPSHIQWPWAIHNHRFQKFQGNDEGPFSHSYPERIWSRYKGHQLPPGQYELGHGQIYLTRTEAGYPIGREPIDVTQFPKRDRMGIRYRHGDLNDVVDLLVRQPLTRQAYLPIWFPEDTGAHHGERVPCTLGYHFMMRDNRLSCRYFMRSCDIIRHFADDVYMAARLTQWICDEVDDRWEGLDTENEYMFPGELRMNITSLHAFIGDDYRLRQIVRGSNDPVHDRLGGSSQPS